MIIINVQKLFFIIFIFLGNLQTALDFPLKEQFNALFKPIIVHMKENGQELAALRTMFLFYHLQMGFVQVSTLIQKFSI